MHRRLVGSTILVVSMVATGASATLAQSAAPDGSPAPLDAAAASAWCEAKGGQVQQRHAYYGTNGDQSQWLDLGRDIDVCRFEAEDGSRIYVDTWTLATTTPTLASSAYLAKVQNEPDPAMGNPATQNCSELGGTSVFGPGASGGGWVDLDDPVDQVVALCMFADGSAIDEWGITYYSTGAVRGADLAPLFGWSGPPVAE